MNIESPDEIIWPALFTATIQMPPPPAPIFHEIPPPPEPIPEPLPLLIVALAAGAIIDKPPREKKEPKHKDKEAATRVLKVKDAYEVIDEVVKSKEISICLLKMLPALWHIQQAHFPAWVDIASAEDDINVEVTERLRNKLKDAMFERVLQQKNKRLRGTFDIKGRGALDVSGLDFEEFPEVCRQRRGTMHHDKETGHTPLIG